MRRPRFVIHIAQTVDARISFRRGPSKKKWEDIIASETPNATPLWGRVLGEKIRPNALLSGSDTLLFSARKRKQNVSPITADHRVPRIICLRMLRGLYVRRIGPVGTLPLTVEEEFHGGRGRGLSGGRIGIPSSWSRRAHLTPIFLNSGKRIPYLVAGFPAVDLSLALKKIYDELDARCIACLGGGRLNGALLRAGLVGEISIVLVPMIVGGGETPTSFDASELGFAEIPLLLNLVESKVQEDGSVWLRYSPRRNIRDRNPGYE